MQDDALPAEKEGYVLDLFAWLRDKVGINPAELLKCDDWMLVIKVHAMIESALNLALVIELREPRLAIVIGKMPTSDGSVGKVAFVNALGILSKPSVDFLRELSSLRNFCVHNIRNFTFDLAKHLKEHQKGEELRRAILKGMKAIRFPEEEKMPQKLLSDDPRLAIIFGSIGIMAQLHAHNEKCGRRDAETELQRVKAARLDEIEPRQSTSTK